MSVGHVIWAVALGGLVGILSGLIGVGGGIILIPALVYFFGMDQHIAQGTSLAMLLAPMGILAFLEYYKAGNVNWHLGLIITSGVFLAQHNFDFLITIVFSLAVGGLNAYLLLHKDASSALN